jgi:plastocyanin
MKKHLDWKPDRTRLPAVPARAVLRALLVAALPLALLIAAAPASAGPSAPEVATLAAKPKKAKETYLQRVEYPGMQRFRYRFGPIRIKGGADDILIRDIPKNLRPSVPGYITRFQPTLTYADGSLPSVDVIHLHHAVWLVNFAPTFAAGEEKSIAQMPKGFGFRYTPQQDWRLNDMIHNLETTPREVYVVWDIDFVPDSAPAAASIKPVNTQWMDVAGISTYPVFDSLRKYGKKGRFTFPDDARGQERKKVGHAQEWTVRQPSTIVGTVGHLHPGGLYTDLFVTRDGKKKRIFRSTAKYYGPAGPVTWNVSMFGTTPQWRVELKPGDVVSVSATYDTTRASWYEGMGIMPLAVYRGTGVGGVDPFITKLDQKGMLTHGELKENRDTAGGPIGMPDPRSMATTPFTGATFNISDYFYARGDLNKRSRIPVVKPGQALTFENKDWDALGVLHTITACAAPCNRRGGISFPLADGPVEFDSGNLGITPIASSFGAGRTSWSTPTNLKAGTYTYFCRIHPFMRGAFKVDGAAKKKKKS